MDKLLDSFRNTIRSVMRRIAHVLNDATNGQVHPNTVTLIGVAMHIPIALVIAADWNILAGILLIIFGLFDTLDGELARLQHRASRAGMLLDSTTDRMKEVMLYTGTAANFVIAQNPWFAVWAVAACGGSLLVSYVNAWGEVVLAHTGISKHNVNQMFRGGLMRFEIRMLFLAVGLLTNHLAVTVAIIAALAWFTALQRLILILKDIR